ASTPEPVAVGATLADEPGELPAAGLALDSPTWASLPSAPVENWPPLEEIGPPAFPPFPPVAAPTSKRRRTVAVVVALALMASLTGFVAWRLEAYSGPRYPKAWDPKVADLVKFIETERGMTFDHPVYIDYMSNK